MITTTFTHGRPAFCELVLPRLSDTAAVMGGVSVSNGIGDLADVRFRGTSAWSLPT